MTGHTIDNPFSRVRALDLVIDLLRASFVLGTVVFALLGNPEAIRMAAGVALVLVARQAKLPRSIDLMVCIAIGLEIYGQAFGLYDSLRYYDKFVHFFLPLLLSPVAYITLSRLHVVPDLREEAARSHYAGIWLITFSVVAAFGGTVWEVFEYASDRWLGSNLTFGYVDSISDMACTAAGSALGGLFLVVWAERRWGTRRGGHSARPDDVVEPQPPREASRA